MNMLPILFEDGEALVIDKPAGLAIDRPRAGGVSLDDFLDGLRLGFHRRPAAVHRLDRDTSGCLLLARNPKALKRYAKAFEDRTVTKRYLGIVGAAIADDAGIIDLALSKVSSAEQGWRMIAAEAGKSSVTHWRKLAERDGNTLVEFRPETGRTHQIRIHAAAGLGHALLGDPVYGRHVPGIPAATGAGRTMLHAAALTVPRASKPAIEAVSPLPDDFAQLGFADG